MNRRIAFLLSFLCSASAAVAQPAFTVGFEKDRYDISSGDTFQVTVAIDPSPAHGLYSYGVKLTLNSSHAKVRDLDGVIVPATLNFNTVLGPPAIKAVGEGLAAAKGSVDFDSEPSQAHTSPLITTFLVTDLGPGLYTLSLESYNTLGPTEELFVDGAGKVLDKLVQFGTAAVNHLPSISIIAPSDGTQFTFPAVVHIEAQAGDVDGPLAKVEFFEGVNKLGERISPPYQFSWSDPSIGAHSIMAVATDELGAQTSSAPLQILIQPNVPPVLSAIGDKTVNEDSQLSFTVLATDANLPLQELTFSLDAGAPQGASITPKGFFTWTPSQAQGPNTYTLTMRVQDSGSPALGDARGVKITVNEINVPPVLASIGDKTATEGILLSFTATATDSDIPLQKLTFSLGGGAPTGAGINPATGVFTWTPGQGQSSSPHPLAVRVTDAGSPVASASETIKITVFPPPEPYAIFANEANLPVGSKVLNWNGSENKVTGKIHSNSDIDVSGNKYVFRDGSVEYVTGINPSPNFKGKVTLQGSTLVRSTVKPYPVDHQLSEFKPGAPSAAAAQSAGKYFYIKGDTSLASFTSNRVLKEGLYFVEGKVQLSGDSLAGKVTIVATDEIQFSGSGANFEPFTRCLFALSGKQTAGFDKPAISFSSSSLKWQGIVFAPSGGIDIPGSGNSSLSGALIARGLKVSGSDFQITGMQLDSCPIAPKSLSLGGQSNLQLHPWLTSVLADGEIILSFPTVSGFTYLVEYADSLSNAQWNSSAETEGDGSVQSFQAPRSADQRFYRLRIEPSQDQDSKQKPVSLE